MMGGAGVGAGAGGYSSRHRGGRKRPVPPECGSSVDPTTAPLMIPTGTSVSLFGLRGNGIEHNGKTGTIQSYDEKRDRYTVDLDDDSSAGREDGAGRTPDDRDHRDNNVISSKKKT